jgi:4-hydroxy-tetrahydrodipicolinate reductase
MVVADQLLRSGEFNLTSVIGKAGSSKVGRLLSQYIRCDQELVITGADQLDNELKTKKIKVAIDFTSPEGTLKNARLLAEHGVHMVVGTTGFNNMQLYELKKLVQEARIGLVYAPNISLGINLLLSISKTIARLVPHYDVEITESCHRDKKDAPSGTAQKIASEITDIREFAQAKHKSGRKGNKSGEPEEIGIHSIRAGGIVGEHRVLFAGDSDEIEITHRSYSRVIFAEGALKAAAFIAGLKGFYHMEDVLLLERMDRDMRLAANRLYLKFN